MIRTKNSQNRLKFLKHFDFNLFLIMDTNFKQFSLLGVILTISILCIIIQKAKFQKILQIKYRLRPITYLWRTITR